MLIPFSKMHGLGNDFVVFNAVAQTLDLDPDQIRRIADRRLGIGCDQVLIVDPADSADVDFRYRIFNADGSEVGQCGNGVRCLFRFVRDQGLSDKDELVAASTASTVRLRLEDDGQVTVDMGVPVLQPADIPFQAAAQAVEYALDLGGQRMTIGAVSMGNPHAVTVVEDIDSAPVAELGPLIEGHPEFPERVNAGFMQVLSPDHIRLRVYERGAGETQACGTGACAAVVSGRLRALLDAQVRVELPGGELMIRWAGEGEPVLMTGPAEQVYNGQIEI